MKKTWLTPDITELTIKATAKKDNNMGDADTFSPDEFHPERFVSGAIAATATPFPQMKPHK